MTETNTPESTPPDPNSQGRGVRDQSHLVQLYPTPKTYEQRKRDDIIRQLHYRSRWPRRPYLNVALYGGPVIGMVLWFMQNIETWWTGSDTEAIAMKNIFFSFSVSVIILALLYAWIHYVHKIFQYFSGSAQVFWAIYIVFTIISFSVVLAGYPWSYKNGIWIPVLATSHVLFIFVCAKKMLREPN
jgi:hypothetical protein